MTIAWNQLSVLLAGYGSIGKRHLQVLKDLAVDDVRICDANRKVLHPLDFTGSPYRIYDSYEDALSDAPDVVFLCTPPHLHIPMAKTAVNANCDVLIEKPLSDTTRGVKELEVLARQKRKKIMVALCFRFHAGVQMMRQYLDSGAIGRLVNIRAFMGEHLPDIRPDYATLPTSNSSGVFDLMHDIDLTLWMADQPVQKTHGYFGQYSDIGIEAPDIVELLIQFQDRCIGSVHLDFFHRPRRRTFELIGTQGFLSLEFAKWDECSLTIFNAPSNKQTVEVIPTNRNDMFRSEDKAFLEAVHEDASVPCSLRDGLLSLHLIEILLGNSDRRRYKSL